MHAPAKSLDLVVLGATGYTGRLVAEYLLQQYPPGGVHGLRWTLAGRNLEKLHTVRDTLGAPAALPLLVADTEDPASLQALMAQTRLVLSTVGPYQQYGTPLVEACAAAGVHYVDLCGEPPWMRAMIDAHEATARASGARIVFSCGFDSIPFDLGVLYLQDQMHQRHGSAATRVQGRVMRMRGKFSGGTAASLNATLAAAQRDPAVLALLRDPFSLTPGFTGPEQPRGNKPAYDAALGQWVAPFVMAPINTRNIHRSNFLLGHAWGEDFVYDEMLATGPGPEGEARAQALAADRSLGPAEQLKPGEGPTPEEREKGYYDLLFIGHDAAGHEIRTTVRGQRDPGYGATSRMITEAAVCLLRDAGDTHGGIWTPASAMGLRLLPALQGRAGMRFAVETSWQCIRHA